MLLYIIKINVVMTNIELILPESTLLVTGQNLVHIVFMNLKPTYLASETIKNI